jgi:8-oxo-dGTP pyrophosphatase MutT (NUDIX family)
MSRREWLRGMLLGYEPVAEGEVRDLGRMMGLLGVAGDVFSREHFMPGHFTASAFVVSAGGESLLLVHHRKLDKWLQPGGHVEAQDADLVAAARREVGEETSLAGLEWCGPGIFDVDIHVFPARGEQPAHEHFDVRFLFRCVGDGEAAVGDEVHAARWFDLEELAATPQVTAGLDRPIAKLVGRGR